MKQFEITIATYSARSYNGVLKMNETEFIESKILNYGWDIIHN